MRIEADLARAAAAAPLVVGEERISEVTAVLRRAFADDPLLRWICRAPPHHEEAIAGLIEFGVRVQSQRFGHCYLGSEGHSAAVWLPPQGVPTLGVSLGMQIRYRSWLFGATGLRRLPRAMAHGAAFSRHHPKEPPHWYLYFLGVEPELQGRGIGSSILAATLASVDASGLPAYLDNSNPRNLRLYERHGFRVRSEYRARRDAPPIWGMWRPGAAPASG